MAQFLDYDPDFEYDEATGVATISQSQDIQPFIDKTKALANISATDSGIKRGFWHYASIPPVVQIALRAKGLDIYSKDPTMTKRVLKEINQNYAWCKTTSKTHA